MTAYIVSSGVTSSGITLGALDTLTVLSGGVAFLTTDGGHETVSSGGTDIDATVLNHGVLTLAAGAVGEAETIEFGGILGGGDS